MNKDLTHKCKRHLCDQTSELFYSIVVRMSILQVVNFRSADSLLSLMDESFLDYPDVRDKGAIQRQYTIDNRSTLVLNVKGGN